jgi:hypothetical protein
MTERITKTLGYIKSRLQERATWAAIGVGVTGAATLVVPWNYLFIAIAVIGALVPTPDKSE